MREGLPDSAAGNIGRGGAPASVGLVKAGGGQQHDGVMQRGIMAERGKGDFILPKRSSHQPDRNLSADPLCRYSNVGDAFQSLSDLLRRLRRERDMSFKRVPRFQAADTVPLSGVEPVLGIIGPDIPFAVRDGVQHFAGEADQVQISGRMCPSDEDSLGKGDLFTDGFTQRKGRQRRVVKGNIIPVSGGCLQLRRKGDVPLGDNLNNIHFTCSLFYKNPAESVHHTRSRARCRPDHGRWALPVFSIRLSGQCLFFPARR